MTRLTPAWRRIRLPERRTLALLALILLIGFGARTIGLGDRPLWADEARYMVSAEQMRAEGKLVQQYPTVDAPIEGQRPLHFYMLAAVDALPGTPSEFLVRLPSAVIGTLMILLVFLLGTTLYGEMTGVIAAAITAVEPNHVLYSRNAIPNITGMFAIGLVFYAFLRFRELPDRRTAAGLVAATLLALTAHGFSVIVLFLLPALFLVAYLIDGMRRTDATRYTAMFAVTSFLTILVSRLMIPHRFTEKLPLTGASVHHQYGDFRTAAIVFAVPVQDYIGQFIAIQAYYLSPSFLFLPLLFALIPAAILVRRWTQGRDLPHLDGTAFLYTWYFVTVLVLAVPAYAALRQYDLSIVRGQVFLSVPLILLTAAGARQLIDRIPRSMSLLVILFLAYLAHMPVITAGTTITPPVDTVTSGEIPSAAAFTASTGSIVCSGEHYRPPFCFRSHPVGVDETIDWRQAVAVLDNISSPGEQVYASMAGPVIYYGNLTRPVHGLTCNAGHRRCNLVKALFDDSPTWVVTDPVRIDWQLNEYERWYVTERCAAIPAGGLVIRRCT